MAIVVEEEKRETNWVAILTAAIVIVVLFAGSYFLFFKKPELIEIVVPKRLEDLSKISKVTFDPQLVIDAPAFKLLKQYDVPTTLPTPGRNNPFRPF